MSTGVGHCRHCGHHVAVTAEQCRFCGYTVDADPNHRDTLLWGLCGVLALLTVIAIPIGLLLLWKTYRRHRATGESVVDAAHPPATSPATLIADARRVVESITDHNRPRT